MKRIVLLAAALFASPALAEEPAQMQPGLWRIHVQVTSLEMANEPQGLRDVVMQEKRGEHCVTPEDAAAGLIGLMPGEQCRVILQTNRGGRLDAEVECRQPGATVTATIRGYIKPNRVELHTVLNVTAMERMRMTAVTTAERVGACE
jgi:hypothetical protein